MIQHHIRRRGDTSHGCFRAQSNLHDKLETTGEIHDNIGAECHSKVEEEREKEVLLPTISEDFGISALFWKR